MGETRVDLQHLLEDLRDAYSGSLEETILTEVVANALDSRATRVRLLTNPAAATVTIVDDGRGMQRRELARYHDIAASRKKRGEGIGFAGVGIKLGLLAAREVVTETRRGSTHVATRWHLASRHRAPWKWMPAPGLTTTSGTAVQLTLANQLSPLLDAGYLEETIRRHFEPLLDDTFAELLRRHYPRGVVFDVDGRALVRGTVSPAGRVPIAIRLGRRRTPSVVGYLERHAGVPPDREGVAVSTFGKVIKRGWDWLGMTPGANASITGLIEAPELAECLTLNKNDFIRTGARGATYLAYRKAIQEVVSRQLLEWGDRRDPEARPRMARLERDLERVLADLADDFPLLRSLVDRRRGGQKRLPMPGRGQEQAPAPLFADVPENTPTGSTPTLPGGAMAHGNAAMPHDLGEATPTTPGLPPQPSPHTPPHAPPNEPQEPDEPHEPPSEIPPDAPQPSPAASEAPVSGAPAAGQHDQVTAAPAVSALDTVPGRRQPARYGLLVQFEARPDDLELGRLVDSTIWINESHPAYVRAVASRSLGYHTALAVALALAPLAVETSAEHAFITQFLAQWGATPAGRSTGRPRRTRR